MKVYYAHPLNIYNTPQEQRDLDTLAALFGAENILNPNAPEIDALYKTNHEMKIFFDLVKTCDVLAFRPTPFGKITAGVASEIQVAKDNGKLIIELPTFIGRNMSVDATREYLAEVGQR
jgi:hypothetical protein